MSDDAAPSRLARPGKIICVGRNYLAHAQELGNRPGERPLLFMKPPSAVISTGESIRLPAESARVDYEGEIGVVVGRRLGACDPATAALAVEAYVALNDVTARDLQRSDGQWTRAKGYDTFCPIGPPVPAAGVDPARLEVVTRVNGAERQRGRAADMVFAIPDLLAYIAGIMTLEPGDVVATGTPAGVGPLHEGDEVEVEITGGSVVRNPVLLREENTVQERS